MQLCINLQENCEVNSLTQNSISRIFAFSTTTVYGPSSVLVASILLFLCPLFSWFVWPRNSCFLQFLLLLLVVLPSIYLVFTILFFGRPFLRFSDLGLLFGCLELALSWFARLCDWIRIGVCSRITTKLCGPALWALQLISHRYSIHSFVVLERCSWNRIGERFEIMVASYFEIGSVLPLAGPADRSQVNRGACLIFGKLHRPVLISTSGTAILPWPRSWLVRD